MTYVEQIAELAQSVATLVGEDRSTERAPSPEVAFACRDVLVDRLTETLGAVLNTTSVYWEFPARHVASDPAHALHAALRELPRLSAPDRPPLIEALDSRAGSPPSSWQVVGRAALLLQPYEERLRLLPGPAAWQAVRQVTAIAATLPYLDADLEHRYRTPKIDPGSHDAIRFAVAKIDRRAPKDQIPYHVEAAQPVRVVPIRGLVDLPEATAQLGELIALRSERIGAAETRAVARMLTDGLDVTARALRSSDRTGQDELAASFEAAAVHLAKLYTTPLATIGKPAPTIQYLAAEATTILRALDGVLDRVANLATSERDKALGRLTERSLAWAAYAPAVTDALSSALRSAHRTGNLFGHPEVEATRQLGLTWVPAETPPHHSMPRVLAAAQAGAQALDPGRALLATAIDQVPARAQLALELAETAVERVNAAVRARDPLPRPSLPEHPRIRTGSRRATDLARATGRPKHAPDARGHDRPQPGPVP